MIKYKCIKMGDNIMWIEKAAKNSYGLYNLIEQYLDKEAYNNINIIGKVNIAGEEYYKVTATQYIKEIERNFYFGDFCVLTDLFDNANYVRKQRDILSDVGWQIIVRVGLKDEDVNEYKKQFKEYQRAKIKIDREILNEFTK